MFNIYYKDRYYKAVDAIEIEEDEYLILAKDEDRFIFLKSSDISEFEEYKKEFKKFALSLTLEKTSSFEVDLTSGFECEHSNLDELSFIELFSIYHRLCRISDISIENLKEKLSSKMGKKLASYKDGGFVDTYFNFSNMEKIIMSVQNCYCYSDAVNYLVEEFKIYIAIRGYMSLNIYDLIFEHTKLIPVARGYVKSHPLIEMGISPSKIKNRIEPAINYIRQLKLDLILIEILGIASNWQYLNPYRLEKEDLKERKYFFDPEKRQEFKHEFFKDIGISTEQFLSELLAIEKYKYSFIVEELLLKAGNAIENIFMDKNKTFEYTNLLYGDIGFVRYLISIIEESY